MTNRKVILLVLISALGPTTMNMFLPAVPIMREEFHTTVALMQSSISIGMIAFTIGTLLNGFISDRIGRKKTIIGGIIIYLIGNFIAALSTSITMFMISRVLSTFGGSAISISVRASISDIYGKGKAAVVYAWISATIVFVPLIAPTAGGYITAISSWNYTFVVMVSLGLLALLLSIFVITETLSKKKEQADKKRSILHDIRQVISSKQWWIYAFLCGTMTSVSFAFTTIMPYIGKDLFALSPAGYGSWLIISALGYLAGNLTSTRISERHTMFFMTTLGASLSFAFMLALLGLYALNALSTPTLFITMSLINFGAGLAIPTAISAAVNSGEAPKGASSSMQGLIHTSIPIFAVQFVGSTYDGTMLPMLGTIAFFTTISFVIALLGLACPTCRTKP